MIPYEELSAALERWRVKNGLPGTPPLFAEGSTMSRPSAMPAAAPAPSPYSTPSYSAPPPAPAPSYSASSYGSGPLYAPPAAAPSVPPPPSPETLDEAVDEFAEDDVLDEAQLDNDGPDYAMAFSDAPPAAAGRVPATLTDEDDHESTTIGTPGPALSPEDEDEFNASEKTPV
jgi:hypothetical protein